MQRPGYLHKLGDKQAIVPSEPQETLALSDSGSAFLITFIFSSSVTTPWVETMNVPQVCDLSVEELTF